MCVRDEFLPVELEILLSSIIHSTLFNSNQSVFFFFFFSFVDILGTADFRDLIDVHSDQNQI